MNNIFQKFTNHSRQALKNAFSLALSYGHKNVMPDHILYGIYKQKGSVGSEILSKSKIDAFKLKEIIRQSSKSRTQVTEIDLSVTSKKVLEKAVLIASVNNHRYVGTEHLLAGMTKTNDPKILEMFDQNKLDYVSLEKQVYAILNSTSKFPNLTGEFDEDELSSSRVQNSTKHQPLALDFFAINLTNLQIQKNIDPVIGREQEIERLIQILSRRNKNNPVLLGDPGVGKTAIVEGLAKKIISRDVPEVLLGKKIYALDLSLLVAGTSFRGEFENRLKQIISEVKQDSNIILFIDEVHTIAGAGSAAGSMDAANILKPALARGEIRCIGATTTEEFKKNIESDAALERRFQPIIVHQPTIEKTIEILHGVKNNYEIFHQVTITDEAIVAAAHLSERYVPDRFLPDKAIDLIDEAASALKIQYGTDDLLKNIFKLEEQLYAIQEKKQQKVENDKFNLALNYKKQEQQASDKLQALKQQRLAQKQFTLGKIQKQDIANIVAKITGVPASELVAKEKNQLLRLEKSLTKKIVGQDYAVKSVAEFVRRSRAGIADTNRPIGSFMFLGPSGVGKTELSKTLAENVFGSSDALIRIDMSEFGESFNTSKLIGSPAGYIGYKDGARLTDSVKKRPYSVVLFDEIEKAHPQIFNLLLSILEDGYITDATGKKINFKNTIIIMTSNIGSEEFSRQAEIGFDAKTTAAKQQADNEFDETKKAITKKLKGRFRPEFLNRLDKIVIFKPLDKKAITKIASLQLKELKQRLLKNEIELTYTPAVSKWIAKISYSPQVGARAIRKTIQNQIENLIANHILNTNSKKINIAFKDNKIVIS